MFRNFSVGTLGRIRSPELRIFKVKKKQIGLGAAVAIPMNF